MEDREERGSGIRVVDTETQLSKIIVPEIKFFPCDESRENYRNRTRKALKVFECEENSRALLTQRKKPFH